MKHEEFLKQVKVAADVVLEPQPVCPIEDVWVAYWNATAPQEVLKLLAIIEKLKEQRNHWAMIAQPELYRGCSLQAEDDKDLDDIVE